ncbi:hypothetical protein ACFL3D_00350 [Candidatus Omnitrophota bacterium]
MKKIKKHSDSDLATIDKKAHDIWEKKCNSFNKALNDWLEAERETREQLSIQDKDSCEYTAAEVAVIKTRAQTLHEEKIKLLNSALDDWLEAEKAVEKQLANKPNIKSLFNVWASKVSASFPSSLKKEASEDSWEIYQGIDNHYVEMMREIMS